MGVIGPLDLQGVHADWDGGSIGLGLGRTGLLCSFLAWWSARRKIEFSFDEVSAFDFAKLGR